MIVGGGLPRALGFLFAILTLHQASALYSGAGRARLASTTILASLTVLCHPVVAWFTFYSLAVLLLFKARNRRGLTVSAIVVVGTIVLTAPWWGTNIARHGVEPFLAAFQAGTRPWSAILAPFLFMQTNEPFLTLQAVFALLGLFFCLRRREFHLPVWLAAVFCLEFEADGNLCRDPHRAPGRHRVRRDRPSRLAGRGHCIVGGWEVRAGQHP